MMNQPNDLATIKYQIMRHHGAEGSWPKEREREGKNTLIKDKTVNEMGHSQNLPS